MAFYKSDGVDGNGGSLYSLTQDPFKPIEAGVAGLQNSGTSNQVATAGRPVTSGTLLRVVRPGSGYSAASAVATTTGTTALNTWSGQTVHGSAVTTVTVNTTVDSEGGLATATVATGATGNYRSGDWISVAGGTGGVLEITTEV